MSDKQDDWQPGDLAMCVHPKPLHPAFQPGSVWTVLEVAPHETERVVFRLVGVRPRNGYKWFSTNGFRKIRPHTPDAEDAETIRLLTGVRIPATAGE